MTMRRRVRHDDAIAQTMEWTVESQPANETGAAQMADGIRG
ncbi:hypothetical protein PSRA_0051 [Pseudoscardovia radai]|uniref:Uncharacterized protein n=1 Tax=Pseudoscardovia radai TaxID=987066 RepID=A0A261F2A1_9BIFI|nr:hypothetical protein PSRA_0051 [Pseudoscardovia radai]